MASLPLPLKVAILDTDSLEANALKTVIEAKQDIVEVKIFNQIQSADEAFSKDNFNSLFIDIFSLGVEIGIKFIEHVRSEYPTIPICLYSSSQSLRLMPSVNDYWRTRFNHYYQLAKDQTIQNLDRSAEQVLEALSSYLQAATVRFQLSNLRKQLSQESVDSLSAEQKREIEKIAADAEKALEPLGSKSQLGTLLVPGMNTEQVEELVNETLKDAKKSLQMTTNVNIGVLVAGSLLVAASFTVATITSQWEAVAFGGFGIAGVIASLIANPLRSIGISARRLVQIQVAYLAFLSQLRLINRDWDETTIIEQSKQLGDEMSRTLKALDEYFGK
jgi:DNA-binding NarL/FixJ family response regulator